jgi:GT2 family glycosyltransferase
LRTISSLTQSPGNFEVIVIDQSDAAIASEIAAALPRDPRLRHVRSSLRGKGAALNEGLRLASADIVVCTDDDCEAPPGWIEQMAEIAGRAPSAAVVFCNVLPPAYDRAAGYVPAYVRQNDRVVSSVLDARHGLGLGAGMALRRDRILAIGGFDESFGPGSRFGSADDWDIALRAVLKGWQVHDTAAAAVTHHGFRTLAEGRAHAARDWIAIGALCAKLIRAGSLQAVWLALWLFAMEGLWPPLRDLTRLRRPSGLARIRGFIAGLGGGLRQSVDAATLQFIPVSPHRAPQP